MSKLVWDQTGDRLYETGVQKGVLLFHIGNAVLIQHPLGIVVAPLAEVLGVVVGQGHRLHGRGGHDLHILLGALLSQTATQCSSAKYKYSKQTFHN